MRRNHPVNILFIAALVLGSAWLLYPTVSFYLLPVEKRHEKIRQNPKILNNIINMGLDLQGGMRLVLEIDRSQLADKNDKDVLDRAYTIIENRINGLGVSEPTIQKQGTERLIIELPGLKDARVARNVLGSTAQLQFQLVREPIELQKAIGIIDKVLKGEKDTTHTTDTAHADTTVKHDKQKTVQQEAAKQLFTGKEAAKDSLAVKDSTVPEKKEEEQEEKKIFSDYLVSVGNQIGVVEANKDIVDKILHRADVDDALKMAGLSNNVFLWGHEVETKGAEKFRPLYYLKRKPELSGEIITDAQPQVSQGGMNVGQYVVNFTLTPEGARKFARVTGANVHKFLGIVLDSTVYSAPVIKQKISQRNGVIEGSFSAEDAKSLAVVLRAGALPAPVKIIMEQTVGPSLGQDSINLATKAAIVGLLAVFIFMIFYYKLSGLIASFALFFNLLFTLALMASIGQTLTLPGIAGLLLSLGMAIDANVLINERIREELRLGKTIRSAVDAGYSRAFITILDANLTTIIAALIFLWLGSGPIRGFAVTMSMSLVISMFTAVYGTHIVYAYITASKDLKKLSI